SPSSSSSILFFFLPISRSPGSALFPYTTLFRSVDVRGGDAPFCKSGLGSFHGQIAAGHSLFDDVALADTGAFDDPLVRGFYHLLDRKSTRLNSSHVAISYAVFCLKKKTKIYQHR